jgi:hypothetical protein
MRSVTVSAVVCCLVFAFFAGCKQNQPPATPTLSGPATGVPGKSLVYTFSTTDPEKQGIAYLVSWGDESEEEWDEGYASGEEVTRAHKFTDSGAYCVKVKARDTKLAETGWSDSILVTVAFWPPNQPDQPTGPAACTTGIAYTFKTKTIHPLGDSVWFQFDWGDTVGDWGGPVASDSVYSEEHVFDTAGTYSVTARAKDTSDRTSSWSNPLAVSVIFVVAPDRPAVVYEPLDRGAKLHLTWGTVADAEHYEIKVDDSVRTITDTTYDVTKPCATLEVRAVKGSRKSAPAVIPVGIVETASIVLFGISDPDTSHHHAFGFDTAGTVTTYALYGNEPKLDFYADDLAHHDSMFLANAGKLGNNKGNGLKDAGTTVYDDAKLADTTGYADDNLLVVDRVYYLWLDRTDNGYSTDDNYAKAKILQVSGPLVTMQLGYQRVGGLRWLRK